jgi:mycoredoxin
MALTLYHVSWCPECALVREKLSELGVPYEDIVVPDSRPMRKEVYDISGQYYVPVLKDGDRVLTATWEILKYLEDHYTEGARHETQSEGQENDEFPSCGL